MLKDDIILAQKILCNSVSNITKDAFHSSSFIYRTTNEDISIYQSLFYGKKSLMSIIGSEDQVLNAIVAGINDIDCCDISVFPKYFLMLKMGAIKALNKEEYIRFIFDDFDEDLYDKTRPYLNADALDFWDSLFNFFDSCEIINSTLFSSESYNIDVQIKRNPYLEEYEKLKKLIDLVNINYYDGDISEVLINSKKKYDVVNLSNIISYDKKLRTNYKWFLDFLDCLDREALVFSYLYHVDNFLESGYFNDNVFEVKEKNNTGVLVYKRK